ncbi:hypothetical protein BU16DRAFT_554420 [Lophium mytilinum]|uniref:Cora-domain-containing protein n=1 Tax=Lophium mytilinum TaxID=390894 RepID=A0A6A6RC38_9PEZI|nr:hypothetical protein BU16DRAFT_554420 [Lophium mytilinum]
MAESAHVPTQTSRGSEDRPTAIQEVLQEPHTVAESSEGDELERREADRAGAERHRREASENVVREVDFRQFIIGQTSHQIMCSILTMLLADNPREDERCSPPPQANQKTRNAATYASFGDRGTTASTSAYGDLIQITRYLGVGQSGFVCVDLPSVPQPSDVQGRAKKLMDVSTHNDEAITHYFSEEIPVELQEAIEMMPAMEFIHNRWPLFTAQPINHPHFSVAAQHVIFQDIVFQQCHYETTTKSVTIPSTLLFSANLLIRGLDFVEERNQFNQEDKSESLQYSHSLIANGHNLVLFHKNVKESYTVALVMALFVNGQAQDFEYYADDWYQTRCENPGHLVQPYKPVQVTLAFKLVLLQNESQQNVPLISESDLANAYKAFATPSFTKLEVSSNPQLNFTLGRNLEHILSVCSIPVGSDVVLTCGDISGHRIVTSASFFAFQFLLSMFECLEEKLQTQQEQNSSQQEHDLANCNCRKVKRSACERAFLVSLLGRIKDTCRAHLTWTEQREIMLGTWEEGKAKDMDGLLGANHWATGAKIPHEFSKDVLSLKSLSDWPLNIIKFADFAMKTEDEEIKGLFKNPRKSLRRSVHDWVEALDLENKRGFYAIPRPSSKSHRRQKKYRLEDHVWIWRALLSIESLGILDLRTGKSHRMKLPPRNRHSDPHAQESLLQQSYHSADFKSKVIKRFTTENNVSRRRMIAVSRSASASRFLFHSTDTALFYTTKTPFFDNLDTMWMATNDSQRFHKDNEDLAWENPLQYGLAMMMASNGHQINTRSPPKMLTYAKDILLQSSWRNGLFPGNLKQGSQEPDFGWTDFHWRVSFEVPCTLWECRANVEKAPKKANMVNSTAGQPLQTNTPKALQTLVEVPKKANMVNSTAEQPLLANTRKALQTSEMRKSLPFNNLIDEKSIFELSDEWLYDYPEFLDSNSGLCEEFDHKDTMLRGVIVDVPKSAGTGRYQPQENAFEVSCNQSIYDVLKPPRTAQHAKKRFIWLPNPNRDTKMLCCNLASPKGERECLKQFFYKHDRKKKHFFDEVIATSNLWRTELHLSSYQVFKVEEGEKEGDLKFLGGDMVMRRAGTGFRFVGDFFDRYWTCHVLEHEPKEDSQRAQFFSAAKRDDLLARFNDLIKPRGTLSHFERDKEPWRQRKVLELLLFDLMLQKIEKRYNEMFKETGKRLSRLFPRAKTAANTNTSNTLLVLHTLLSVPMNTDDYSVFRKKWPAFQYTLQVMEEDLKENLENIGLWRNRDSERQLERPRWTRDDERKYRSVIAKLTASNNQRIRDLEHCLADIRSIRLLLDRMSSSTRDELSYQSAENVRFFTYVTVIFLPLGFATGIFSMSAAPVKKTLIGMIITAITAFIILVIALAFRPGLTVWRNIRLEGVSYYIPTKAAEGAKAESVSASGQQRSGKQASSGKLHHRVKELFNMRALRPKRLTHHRSDPERGQGYRHEK